MSTRDTFSGWRLLTTIQWESDSSASVSSPEEVAQLLRRLHQQSTADNPLLVAITSPRGDQLVVGVGRDTSVCSWTAASGDPPYYASTGSEREAPELVFFYLGDWTEFPPEQGIPLDHAIAAASRFVESGERPHMIESRQV